MKIILNFDEMSQILLNHVRKTINSEITKIEIPSAYNTYRDDFCVMSTLDAEPEDNTKTVQV